MDDQNTDALQRIDVAFGVDLPLEEIAVLNEKMDHVRPGSVEYAVIWDKRKALHAYFLGRLEGECQAYMNIAKRDAGALFDFDPYADG